MALRLVLVFAVSLWVGCSLCREREGMCGPRGLEGVLAEGHCLRTGLACCGIFWVGWEPTRLLYAHWWERVTIPLHGWGKLRHRMIELLAHHHRPQSLDLDNLCTEFSVCYIILPVIV